MNFWMNAIGLSLIHFLWQGAIVAAVLAVAMRLFARRHANLRYVMSYGAMVVCALCPVFTFLRLTWTPGTQSSGLTHVSETQTFISAISSDEVVLQSAAQSPPWLSYVVWIWVLGVSILSIRLLGGVWLVDVLRRKRSAPALADYQLQLNMLAGKIGLKRQVQLKDSESISSPSALGVFRVCVIVPVSLWTKFPANQIEALLLHELAHIRRHDYLLNLIQSVIEVVLFYNPAIWWISRVIRIEREHCCDEWVVKITGDSTAYARALCQLDLDRSAAPALSMSARGGLLLQRIARILSQSKSPVRLASLWSVSLPAAAVTLGLVICVRAQSQPQVATVSPLSTLSSILEANLKNPVARPAPKPTQPKKVLVPVQASQNFKNTPFDKAIASLAARDKFAYHIEDSVYLMANVNVTGKSSKQKIQAVCDVCQATYKIVDGKYWFWSKLSRAPHIIPPAGSAKSAGNPLRHRIEVTSAGVKTMTSTIQFKDAKFVDCMEKIASWSGVSYTILEGTYKNVTMNRKIASKEEAISAVCEAAGATWSKQGGDYTFMPRSAVELNPRVLDLQSVKLEDALRKLAKIEDFSYTVSDTHAQGVSSGYRPVNVHITVSDLLSAIKAICDSAGAGWQNENGVYRFYPNE